ncbi:hypothetical protein ACT3R7_11925 [Halomonas sp. AOP43-A1-21]
MVMASIWLKWGDVDAQSKQSRPDRAVLLDLHALGLFELNGMPVQQWAYLPPIEPGALLEVVMLDRGAVVQVVDASAPTLMPGPLLLVCDSAGEEGEVAVAVLVDTVEFCGPILHHMK